MILRIEEHQTPSRRRRLHGREDNARLIPENDAEREKLAELERAGHLTHFRGRGDWERNLRDLERIANAATRAIGSTWRPERLVVRGGATYRQ